MDVNRANEAASQLSLLLNAVLRGQANAATKKDAAALLERMGGVVRAARAEAVQDTALQALAAKGVAVHNTIRERMGAAGRGSGKGPQSAAEQCAAEVTTYLRAASMVLVSLSPSRRCKDTAQICVCLARAGVSLMEITRDSKAAVATFGEVQQYFDTLPEAFWKEVNKRDGDDLLLTVHRCIVYKVEALRQLQAGSDTILSANREMLALLRKWPLRNVAINTAEHLMAQAKRYAGNRAYEESIRLLQMSLEALAVEEQAATASAAERAAGNGEVVGNGAAQAEAVLAARAHKFRQVAMQSLATCHAKQGNFAESISCLNACLKLYTPEVVVSSADGADDCATNAPTLAPSMECSALTEARADILQQRIIVMAAAGDAAAAMEAFEPLLETGDFRRTVAAARTIAEMTAYGHRSLCLLARMTQRHLSNGREHRNEAVVCLLEALLKAQRLRGKEGMDTNLDGDGGGRGNGQSATRGHNYLRMAEEMADLVAAAMRQNDGAQPNSSQGSGAGKGAVVRVALSPDQADRARKVLLGFVDVLRFGAEWEPCVKWCERAMSAMECFAAPSAAAPQTPATAAACSTASSTGDSSGGSGCGSGGGSSGGSSSGCEDTPATAVLMMKLCGIRGEVLCTKLGKYDEGQRWLLRAISLSPGNPMAQRAPFICIVNDPKLSERRLDALLAIVLPQAAAAAASNDIRAVLQTRLNLLADIAKTLAAAVAAATAGGSSSADSEAARQNGQPPRALLRCLMLVLERWALGLSPSARTPDNDDATAAAAAGLERAAVAAVAPTSVDDVIAAHIQTHGPLLVQALGSLATGVVAQTNFPEKGSATQKPSAAPSADEERRQQWLLERLASITGKVLSAPMIFAADAPAFGKLEGALWKAAHGCFGGDTPAGAANDGPVAIMDLQVETDGTDPKRSVGSIAVWLALATLFWRACGGLATRACAVNPTHSRTARLRFAVYGIASHLEAINEALRIGDSWATGSATIAAAPPKPAAAAPSSTASGGGSDVTNMDVAGSGGGGAAAPSSTVSDGGSDVTNMVVSGSDGGGGNDGGGSDDDHEEIMEAEDQQEGQEEEEADEWPETLLIERQLRNGSGQGALSMLHCQECLREAEALATELSKDTPQIAADLGPLLVIQELNILAILGDSKTALQLVETRQATFLGLPPVTLDQLVTLAMDAFDKVVVLALCRVCLQQHKDSGAAPGGRRNVGSVYSRMLQSCETRQAALELVRTAARALADERLAACNSGSGVSGSGASSAAAGGGGGGGGGGSGEVGGTVSAFTSREIEELAAMAFSIGLSCDDLGESGPAFLFVSCCSELASYASEDFRTQHGGSITLALERLGTARMQGVGILLPDSDFVDKVNSAQ